MVAACIISFIIGAVVMMCAIGLMAYKKDNNPKSSWVKAEDGLPTKGGHYLCMDENHNISVLGFVWNKWINTKTFADVPLEVVIYWMPKPPLPKE